jgi:hypothetical protein
MNTEVPADLLVKSVEKRVQLPGLELSLLHQQGRPSNARQRKRTVGHHGNRRVQFQPRIRGLRIFNDVGQRQRQGQALEQENERRSEYTQQGHSIGRSCDEVK